MPYILQETRDKLASHDEHSNMFCIDLDELNCGGDLNYLFTFLAGQYIEQKGLRYQNISDVLGAYNGSQREIERLVIDPYEEYTELKNGGIDSLQNLNVQAEDLTIRLKFPEDEEFEGEVIPFNKVENDA